ncbi:MAG TPA: GatB/YqeY domain-containing protein [Phaeodactylibacter sp.]|nr:GatB/YqeY domain-containing protein [Phaeodactylibacter sp.]
MNLEAKVMQALKQAMKDKDEAAKRGLRAIKNAILLYKTSGEGSGELDEAAEIKLLQKLVKQRQDSLDIYEKQGREDLAQTEREELEVINRFLPKQLSEEELTEKLKAIIQQTGASSMKDMGKVMGLATKELAGQADGKTISQIVRKLLS